MYRTLVLRALPVAASPLGLTPAASAQAVAQEQAQPGELARCQHLQEHARAEATTLQWPELVVQGLRFPQMFGIDDTTWGDGFQARVAMAFSPSDLIKGVKIRRLADAQCKAQQLELQAQQTLDVVVDQARLVAIRAKSRYLAEQREVWEGIYERAQRRLEAQLITRNEIGDVRRKTMAFERQMIDLEGEAGIMATRGIDATDMGEAQAISPLLRRYVDAELDAERAHASVRGMSAWQLRLTAGAIPTPEMVDWYSIAELRLSLGSFKQSNHLRRAEDAKREALRDSVRHLPTKMDRLQQEAKIIIERSREQLTLIERQLAMIESDVVALAAVEHAHSEHVLDSLHLERIAAEADRRFLHTLINRLRPLVDHGSHHE